jgi:hypothetical protein
VIAGDDPAPWQWLEGGTVVAIERTGDEVAIVIERQALRARFVLAGVDAVHYQPHDEPMLYELDAIAASQPDLREASVVDHAIVVIGGAGTLRLAYANLTIEIDGARVDVDELRRRASR